MSRLVRSCQLLLIMEPPPEPGPARLPPTLSCAAQTREESSPGRGAPFLTFAQNVARRWPPLDGDLLRKV